MSNRDFSDITAFEVIKKTMEKAKTNYIAKSTGGFAL